MQKNSFCQTAVNVPFLPCPLTMCTSTVYLVDMTCRKMAAFLILFHVCVVVVVWLYVHVHVHVQQIAESSGSIEYSMRKQSSNTRVTEKPRVLIVVT